MADLTKLKVQATELGIEFSSRIGLKALQVKVDKALLAVADEELNLEDDDNCESKDFGITNPKQAKDSISDLQLWGDSDAWKLIAKASSASQGWMKSTKALEVGTGVVVQVTTQNGDNIAESTAFVPNCTVLDTLDAEGVVVSRNIVHSVQKSRLV